MLVVEPDRRYTLKQIIKHRWLSDWITNPDTDLIQHQHSQMNFIQKRMNTGSYWGTGPQSYSSVAYGNDSSTGMQKSEFISQIPNLDTVVMTNMLQLSGLTADKIAQSVHENSYDSIYAIYYLLYDKLQLKRREQQRLQQFANRIRYNN